MDRIVHIKGNAARLDENTQRLVEFLSKVIPRRPARDKRGRLVRGRRGCLVYPPARLLEGDYSTLMYHLNQCRISAGLESIDAYPTEDE
jgi:hypothetical protein